MSHHRSPKSFTCQQQVRFGHVDPAGIAYYPRIFDYVHEAFEELWDVHVGERYYYLLGEKRIGFPLVHSDVDFKSPLRFGDRPVVKVTCFKLGRSSLGLRYVYELDSVVCLEARMTTVCVNLDTLDSLEIPLEYRERFELLLEGSEPDTVPPDTVPPDTVPPDTVPPDTAPPGASSTDQ